LNSDYDPKSQSSQSIKQNESDYFATWG